jgi:hypothetical protein
MIILIDVDPAKLEKTKMGDHKVHSSVDVKSLVRLPKSYMVNHREDLKRDLNKLGNKAIGLVVIHNIGVDDQRFDALVEGPFFD